MAERRGAQQRRVQLAAPGNCETPPAGEVSSGARTGGHTLHGAGVEVVEGDAASAGPARPPPSACGGGPGARARDGALHSKQIGERAVRICRAPPAPPCPVLTATSSDRDEPHGDVISITVASLGARFGAPGCYFYPHDPAGFWLSPASDRATGPAERPALFCSSAKISLRVTRPGPRARATRQHAL